MFGIAFFIAVLVGAVLPARQAVCIFKLDRLFNTGTEISVFCTIFCLLSGIYYGFFLKAPARAISETIGPRYTRTNGFRKGPFCCHVGHARWNGSHWIDVDAE